MRKLLLASAAVLGASVGAMGFASAQTTNLPPAQIQGQVPTDAKFGAFGGTPANKFPAVPVNGSIAAPTPGSMVIRVSAFVIAYGAAESSSLDTIKGTGPSNTGGAKVDPYGIIGYQRFYFAMDAMATNGMRYGGLIEVRQNYNTPAGGSGANTGSSGATTASTLYVRRAYAYLASANAGLFRLGQNDGPLGMYDYGITTFQGFDDGGWNGDIPALIPGNAQPTFPFLTQQGAEYGSAKAVYFSPSLAGFDFGLSWAPNNQALADTNCSYASSGCYNLSSSAAAGNTDGLRFTNMYEAALRYQGTLGPVGVLAYGGYMGSGQVSYQGPAYVAGVKVPTYKPLSLGQGGAALTVGPVTFGGNVQAGAYQGAGALQPSGGVHAVAWLGGIQYSSGPFTIGTSYYSFDSQGSALMVGISQRHEVGYAAGMTYTLAPGLNLYVSYVYGTRHQGDFNFQTGTPGTAYNNVKGQAFGVGTLVKW
jgi:predicted porin